MFEPKGLMALVVAISSTLLSCVVAAESPPTTSMTLSQAIDASRENNRSRAAAHHRIDEARGNLRQASVLLVDNPELSVEVGPRFVQGGGDSSIEFELGVEQSFGFGRRAHRVEVAEAKAQAAAAQEDDVGRVLDHAVARAFYSLLASQERLELVRANEQLARELFDVAQRRLEVGAGTPLHVNAARIRLAEAQRETVLARGAKHTDSVRLAALLGLSGKTRLTAAGHLPEASSTVSGAQLVRAAAVRPDIAAAAHDVQAAGAAVSLADALAWPELGVGAAYGRDDGADTVLATLRIPLPLFNRNRGARDAARARHRRVSAERDALGVVASAEVQEALIEYEQAREAAAIYDTAVVRAQQDTLRLLARALEVGDIGIGDLIVMQREIARGNRGYVDARLALAHTRAALIAAAGLSQTNHKQGDAP